MRTLSEYDDRWLTRMLTNSARTESGCLVYQGFVRRNGYAANGYQGKTVIVHRKVFEITKGKTLGRWELVCHTCDVRNCIEVAHLWLGTNKQNLHDARAKGRLPKTQQTACINGHDFTPENTWVDKMNWRHCRTCARIRHRVRAGWTRDDASADVSAIPSNAATPRRNFKLLNSFRVTHGPQKGFKRKPRVAL